MVGRSVNSRQQARYGWHFFFLRRVAAAYVANSVDSRRLAKTIKPGTMQIFHSSKHKLRDAETELHGGRLVKPFEAPFRMELVLDALNRQGFTNISEPGEFGMETARRVHDAGYLDFLASAWRRWRELGFDGEAIPVCFPARRMRHDYPPRDMEGALGYYSFSADTSITEGSWPAAISSMECAMAGASALAEGERAAFALCRPPGHHASIDQFGGYCFLNNAAVAAQCLLDRGAHRIGLVDIDFHHGNGTQDIFYRRDDVFFASVHGDPLDAFPHFLGHADETGEGEGENANVNFPLPPGTGFDKWSEALKEALDRCLRHGVEVLVVSLGVDAYESDPISFFRLANDDFSRAGAMIGRAGLPTLFCMEGGYGVAEIGLNTAKVLSGFEKR